MAQHYPQKTSMFHKRLMCEFLANPKLNQAPFYDRVQSDKFTGIFQRLETDRYQMGDGYDYDNHDELIFCYTKSNMEEIYEIHLGKIDDKYVINQVYLVS